MIKKGKVEKPEDEAAAKEKEEEIAGLASSDEKLTEPSMKLVVGLGNPGRKYAGTRHNVGFDVVDLVAGRHRLEWESAPTEALQARSGERRRHSLAKPLTFMNLSGMAIGELLRFYKIELPDLLVVVDDVNLELGRLRARPSRIGRRA